MPQTTFIDFLFEPPLVYLLMVGGILFGVWFLMNKYGLIPKGTPHFKGETLEQIIQDNNLTKIMKTFGAKVKNGKLNLNTKMVKVKKVARFPIRVMVREEIKKKYDKVEIAFKPHEKFFLIFKAGGGIFENIPMLKYMQSEPEYFVIDDRPDFITKDIAKNVWSISTRTFPHTFAGVWIFSQDGVSYLTELAYKRMQENDKEESVNALKRFIFYNDQHTGRIVSMERKQQLVDESFDKMRERAE